MPPHVTMAETARAFGYGLLAAGIVVVMVVYLVIYTRVGTAGLGEALNPFVLVNYASLAAVAPGAVIIWLSGYLRTHNQSGTQSRQ